MFHVPGGSRVNGKRRIERCSSLPSPLWREWQRLECRSMQSSRTLAPHSSQMRRGFLGIALVVGGAAGCGGITSAPFLVGDVCGFGPAVAVGTDDGGFGVGGPAVWRFDSCTAFALSASARAGN